MSAGKSRVYVNENILTVVAKVKQYKASDLSYANRYKNREARRYLNNWRNTIFEIIMALVYRDIKCNEGYIIGKKLADWVDKQLNEYSDILFVDFLSKYRDFKKDSLDHAQVLLQFVKEHNYDDKYIKLCEDVVSILSKDTDTYEFNTMLSPKDIDHPTKDQLYGRQGEQYGDLDVDWMFVKYLYNEYINDASYYYRLVNIEDR